MKEKTRFPKTLWNVGWRYLLRHPWQTVLMVLGITLGVAVVVAIDLANTSASRAFDLSVDAIAGRATHQIVGPPQGIDEANYSSLRTEGITRLAAPVVSEYVTSPQLGDRMIQLLGVDPFAEAPFRDYLVSENGIPVDLLTEFLTKPGAVVISTDLAERYGVQSGQSLTLDIQGQERTVFIAGLLEPADNLSQRALQSLILADISTAQELTGRVGKVDYIDLLVPEGGEAVIEQIEILLPDGLRVVTVSERTGTVEQMTRAFRTNLLALSLLALVVGMFLIYNTMTFSVVQRRTLFGTLRCLGVTRFEVFLMVTGEAFLVGSLGALLGTGLGVLLGQGAVQLVTRTINDLFFVLTVRGLQIPPESLLKGLLLGVTATVLSAALPAWEAASVPPRAALRRSGIEIRAQQLAPKWALAGVLISSTGFGLLALPIKGLVVSFAGTFFVIIGFAFVTPLMTRWFMRMIAPLTAKIWGALGRMAPRDVVNSLSRTSIAVAALMVSVSVTIGISVMVGSFRHTVIVWLEQSLQGDVYISVAGGPQVAPTGTVSNVAIEAIKNWPGVTNVALVRSTFVESPLGEVHVTAVENPEGGGARYYYAVDGSPAEAWQRVEAGEAVVVSEPFARRHGIPKQGGAVTLYSPEGTVTFPVAGIYYDYGRVQGTVTLGLDTYQELWRDETITAIALNLVPGVSPDAVTIELQDALATGQNLLIRPNQALRDEVLVVFDQTFAITGALNILATVVAFIGVLSALLALQLEKQRELGILRSIGLTVRQLWGLVMLETGLMGAVAGLLALPTGFVLSLILIYIINRRSFGWTLQMQLEAGPFVQAVLVAIIAALLAGIYPARKMSAMVTSDAIRFE